MPKPGESQQQVMQELMQEVLEDDPIKPGQNKQFQVHAETSENKG